MRPDSECWDMEATCDNRSAQVIQIESSKLLPSIILLGVIAVAGLIGAAVSWNKAQEARTEARMAEYYITRLDALMVEYGAKKAGDDFQKFKADKPKE